jgi:hypothetical protein
VCLAAGCQLVVSLEAKDIVDASPDATTVIPNDATADVATSQPPPCGRRPTARADAEPPMAADKQKFFVIASRERIDGIAGGFDLDCVDTCRSDKQVCRPRLRRRAL